MQSACMIKVDENFIIVMPLNLSFPSLWSMGITYFSKVTVKSTTETSGVGTRKAMPVSLPFKLGITFPTALAAPVEAGMMFCAAPLPSRQFLFEGPSTVFCVAVIA